MKKLESLSKFNEKKLSETHQSQVKGGLPTPTGTVTAAGSRCTGQTASGCQAYTNDLSQTGVTYYYGTSEVNLSCDYVRPRTATTSWISSGNLA